MSSYIKDPRERCIIPESGITLEEDNRFETMYHWGAKVLDLCEMDAEEYMAPMTVIIDGYDGGGDDDGNKKSVTMTIEVISPTGDIISSNGEVIGNTDGNGEWRALWTWNGDFVGEVKTSVVVVDSNGTTHEITTTISDNQSKNESINFTNISGNVTSIYSYGITESDSQSEEITGKTVTIVDEETETQYDINVVIPTGTVYVLYGYDRKNVSLQYENLIQFNIEEAEGQEGYSFNMVIPISAEYQQKVDELDDEVIEQEEFDQWVENYETQNMYSLRFYVPKDKENDYTYKLYNDNAGQLAEAVLVKSENAVTFDNKLYTEFVNTNDSYLYNDRINTFWFNIKITKN